jgi:farnesyl-diphosphate farnesyltransferase
VSDEPAKHLLKGVSRSFYLTLRLLPAPMRAAASLGYLLARTSDTIADTAGIAEYERIGLLEHYAIAVKGDRSAPEWPLSLLEEVTPEERQLLGRANEVLAWLKATSGDEARLVREVVAIIIGGQIFDLRVFAGATAGRPVPLPDDATLDDYTWRVAGCVGAFWTKLGFLTMGDAYSSQPPELLLEKGIAYGKGLQLVNVLRDLPRDLAMGRCYLPVADPLDPDELMASFRRWTDRASEQVAGGLQYAATLGSRRLRAATVLPALLAEETLDRLRGASWQDLQTRIKVPRSRVYSLMLRALVS